MCCKIIFEFEKKMYSLTRRSTLLPFWYASSGDVPSTKMFVSSANRMKRPRSEQLEMSLM